MVNRLVSVGDDFTLPAAVKAADANLPARLQDTALNSTYAPATGSPNYETPSHAAGVAAALSIVFGG